MTVENFVCPECAFTSKDGTVIGEAQMFDHFKKTGHGYPPKKTLRDEFAMAALSGMLGDPERHGGYKNFATDAFGFADAMLEARGKK
jgi:hypothetical protein